MLRPRAALLSGILRQFEANKKHIKQNLSLSGLHVIVICFRLLRRIQAPFQAVSGKIRQFQQNQEVSGRIKQFQAESGSFRALFRHFQANQAESFKIRHIGQPIGFGRSLVRDPMVF